MFYLHLVFFYVNISGRRLKSSISMLEDFKWTVMYIFRRRKGDSLTLVYVWGHIVSLDYRTTWWKFKDNDRDEVLKSPYKCCSLSVIYRVGSRPARQNVEEGPLMQRILSNRKATTSNQMHSNGLKHVGRSVVISRFIPESNFDAFRCFFFT